MGERRKPPQDGWGGGGPLWRTPLLSEHRCSLGSLSNWQCALIKSPASKGLDLRSDRNTTNLHLDIGVSKNYSVVTPQGSKDRKSNTNATHTINWSMSSEICIPKKVCFPGTLCGFSLVNKVSSTLAVCVCVCVCVCVFVC